MWKNPDEILIEEYRKFEIFFNKKEEIFHCVSDYYDTEQKKKTYAATKIAIDTYIKENSEFRPFYAIKCDWSYRSSGYDFPISNEANKILITGQRKDKRFVAGSEQISESDERYYFLPLPENDAIFDKLAPLIEKRKEYQELAEEKRREILEVSKELTLITLSDYKKTINS